ncbi:hypothetical protein [Nocardioides sp.]|uniref:hypothetical protein n=1 Tax=Nocardioides sp. TaxID=35761 RepID=UPI002BA834CD|nr:hypothetical protein [Nocardioides sp.]HSX67812.1 hypothetical protein [Nocardioides sp.]
MTNGFGVRPDDLPETATALAAAGAQLEALDVPLLPDAGRSSDEVAAAVRQLVDEAVSLGEELTQLGAAFEAAAQSYAAADDAVAVSLLGWGD